MSRASLTRVKAQSQRFFEKPVLKLPLAMGCGEAVRMLPKSSTEVATLALKASSRRTSLAWTRSTCMPRTAWVGAHGIRVGSEHRADSDPVLRSAACRPTAQPLCRDITDRMRSTRHRRPLATQTDDDMAGWVLRRARSFSGFWRRPSREKTGISADFSDVIDGRFLVHNVQAYAMNEGVPKRRRLKQHQT
jgi:hypothetical protein